MPYVAKSKIHGLGVFADKDYSVGDTIELCPYLVTDDSDIGDKSILHNYVFQSPNEDSDEYLIPLGLAMIYNHSLEPNAEWEIHDDNNFVRFKALKTISKGEEIFHNYGEEYWESRNDTKSKKHSK